MRRRDVVYRKTQRAPSAGILKSSCIHYNDFVTADVHIPPAFPSVSQVVHESGPSLARSPRPQAAVAHSLARMSLQQQVRFWYLSQISEKHEKFE